MSKIWGQQSNITCQVPTWVETCETSIRWQKNPDKLQSRRLYGQPGPVFRIRIHNWLAERICVLNTDPSQKKKICHGKKSKKSRIRIRIKDFYGWIRNITYPKRCRSASYRNFYGLDSICPGYHLTFIFRIFGYFWWVSLSLRIQIWQHKLKKTKSDPDPPFKNRKVAGFATLAVTRIISCPGTPFEISVRWQQQHPPPHAGRLGAAPASCRHNYARSARVAATSRNFSFWRASYCYYCC